mgnify:CR=1 FL=1
MQDYMEKRSILESELKKIEQHIYNLETQFLEETIQTGVLDFIQEILFEGGMDLSIIKQQSYKAFILIKSQELT